MAATTITRTAWTDGASGTLLDNSEKTTLYNQIDGLFTSAFTFGDTVSSEGFGDHTFSAGGTGGNTLVMRNTSAGTTNLASYELGNDADADLGRLEAYTSSYTEAGAAKQNGVSLRGMGAGGVSIAAEHASGLLRFYGGGTTLGASCDVNGLIFDLAPDVAAAAPASPDLSRLYNESLVKAWAHVSNSGTPTLDDDYNVTSLTDAGTGLTTVTFATATAVATYAVMAQITDPSQNQMVALTHSLGTGSVQVETENSSGTSDDEDFTVVVIGE